MLVLGLCGVSYAQDIVTIPLTPAATSFATATTNSNAGTTVELTDTPDAMRFYVQATGVAGTTGGTFKVFLETGSTTNTMDTGSLSPIYLSIGNIGNTTVYVSDWFNVTGVKYIRVGEVQNTHGDTVSGLACKITYPKRRQ